MTTIAYRYVAQKCLLKKKKNHNFIPNKYKNMLKYIG